MKDERSLFVIDPVYDFNAARCWAPTGDYQARRLRGGAPLVCGTFEECVAAVRAELAKPRVSPGDIIKGSWRFCPTNMKRIWVWPDGASEEILVRVSSAGRGLEHSSIIRQFPISVLVSEVHGVSVTARSISQDQMGGAQTVTWTPKEEN